VLAAAQTAQARADAGFARVGALWADVLGALAGGLVDELQAAVDKQLARLRRESAGAVADMVRAALDKERALERARALDREREEQTESLKRKPSAAEYAPPPGYGAYADDGRDKRRRLDSPPVDDRSASRGPKQEMLEQNDMMRQMREMLDQVKAENARMHADNARVCSFQCASARAAG
jgi:hypothetical protein